MSRSMIPVVALLAILTSCTTYTTSPPIVEGAAGQAKEPEPTKQPAPTEPEQAKANPAVTATAPSRASPLPMPVVMRREEPLAENTPWDGEYSFSECAPEDPAAEEPSFMPCYIYGFTVKRQGNAYRVQVSADGWQMGVRAVGSGQVVDGQLKVSFVRYDSDGANNLINGNFKRGEHLVTIERTGRGTATVEFKNLGGNISSTAAGEWEAK